MKTNYFLLLSIFILAFALSGCKKTEHGWEIGIPDYVPTKITVDPFHNVSFYTNSYSNISYGYWADNTYYAPEITFLTLADSTSFVLQSAYTGFQNSPSNLKFLVGCRKKGTELTGAYGLDERYLQTRSIFIEKEKMQYFISEQNAIITIDSIGTSEKYGRYVDGRYTVLIYDINDASKITKPAWGTFRVKLK